MEGEIDTMTFVFWQNIISPHQNDFLISLAATPNCVVKLVVERKFDEDRINMGWEKPILDNVEVIVEPSDDIIKDLLASDIKNTCHIYSGITAYPLIWASFKQAIKLKCKVGIMSEPGDWLGWKGRLRLLKSKVEAIFFGSKIDFILSIGNKGREWFEKSGYPKSKIFDWGYFISPKVKNEELSFAENNGNSVKLVYVGRLSKEKGLFEFLQVLDQIQEDFYFKLIGEGLESEKLKSFVNSSKNRDKYEFHGFIPNAEICKELLKFDYLVLPSIGKDGWGTVINEALQSGTKVLVSTNCGSSILISEQMMGYAFDPTKPSILKDILLEIFKKGVMKIEDKRTIIRKAEGILPVNAKNYFLEIIQYVYTSKPSSMLNAPWL